MSVPHRQKLALLFALGAVAPAMAAEPATDSDVKDQFKSVRSLLDQLKIQEQELERKQQLLEQKQEQQAAVEQVVEDADRRSKLLDVEGVNAGYASGRGLVLASDDGRFLLHPWLQFQFRNTTTYREHIATGMDDTQSGFELRRLKFGADGNLFSRDFNYFIQFAIDRHTGNVGLEMAWVKYRFDGSPFAIRAGQFKDPLDHEQLAASRFFPAIDRTFINDTFANAEGFIKGLSVIYDPNASLRAEAAFTGGLKNFNTNFQQYPTNLADWGSAARVEYKASGDWKDYERITAYAIKRRSLVIGTGADYTESGHVGSLVHVVDAQYQSINGWSLYGAYLGRFRRGVASKNTRGNVETYDATARFQASYALDAHWEPYGRFEYVHFNGHEFAKGTQPNVQIVTGGVNYYLYGQSAKITVDINYLPNGSPIADDGFGILANNRHNELVGRAQLQFVI